MPTLHLLISGQVQGVYYRASAKEQADRLKLTGWVKNTPEGHVEITVSGESPALEQFIAWCRQGPPHALVSHVERRTLPDAVFPDFSIRRG